jgi:hypothetical protein
MLPDNTTPQRRIGDRKRGKLDFWEHDDERFALAMFSAANERYN